MEITRRSFLKSIAALAAYSVVPVEITKTIDYLISQPEQPITKSTPSGFMKINGEIFPIVSMDAIKNHSMPQMIYARYGNDYRIMGSRIDDYQEWNLDITYYYIRGLPDYIERLYNSQCRIDFEISPYNSNFIAKGRGSISDWYYTGGMRSWLNDEEDYQRTFGFKIITTEDIIFS